MGSKMKAVMDGVKNRERRNGGGGMVKETDGRKMDGRK